MTNALRMRMTISASQAEMWRLRSDLLLAESPRPWKRAPIRVESQSSLRSREAIDEVVPGILRAKDVSIVNATEYPILEVSADELAAHITEVVRLRLRERLA